MNVWEELRNEAWWRIIASDLSFTDEDAMYEELDRLGLASGLHWLRDEEGGQ